MRAGIYLGTDHDLESLLVVAENIDKKIIIDWGFPPDVSLPTVVWMSRKGVRIWWFDGDRDAARTSFLNRGTVSEEALNIQMEKIDKFWPKIKKLFDGHFVKSIKKGPVYTPMEEIYNLTKIS